MGTSRNRLAATKAFIVVALVCFGALVSHAVALGSAATAAAPAPSISAATPRLGEIGPDGVLRIPLRRQPIPVSNYGNFEYIADIKVGTPAQTVAVWFDTGSADLWVTRNTLIPNGFDPEASTSYKPIGGSANLQYGDGTATCAIGADTVSIGGLDVTVYLGVATSVSNYFKENEERFVGLLGLAFASNALITIPTVFQQLVTSHGIEPVFSVSFLRTVFDGSQILFGGYDMTLAAVGAHLYEAIVLKGGDSYSFWTVRMPYVQVVDRSGVDTLLVSTSSGTAIVDTGTSFIQVPSEYFKTLIPMITRAAGGDCRPDGAGLWTCSTCDQSQLPTLMFSIVVWNANYTGIELVDFPLSPSDYACSDPDCVAEKGACLLTFQEGGNQQQWVLGARWITTYYSVFSSSPERTTVGFARTGAARPVKSSLKIPSVKSSPFVGSGTFFFVVFISFGALVAISICVYFKKCHKPTEFDPLEQYRGLDADMLEEDDGVLLSRSINTSSR